MAVEVRPGAEPFAADGGPLGILLLHGFGGSPASLRPAARWFAARGLAVRVPRLPGHGTSPDDLASVRWPAWAKEADRVLGELIERCDRVGVLGHSMGASLALHLAATRPGDVSALALANPYLRDARLRLVPIARWFVRSTSAGPTDSRSGLRDGGRYDRRPLAGVVTLREFLGVVDRELARVRAPMIVFTSTVDHEIPAGSAERILERVASEHAERVECRNSFHALPLDEDAPMMFERTLAFFSDVWEETAPETRARRRRGGGPTRSGHPVRRGRRPARP